MFPRDHNQIEKLYVQIQEYCLHQFTLTQKFYQFNKKCITFQQNVMTYLKNIEDMGKDIIKDECAFHLHQTIDRQLSMLALYKGAVQENGELLSDTVNKYNKLIGNTKNVL
jgi:hypothetical protein